MSFPVNRMANSHPYWRPRRAVAIWLALAVLVAGNLAGCSDAPSRSQLGHIVYEVPQTPETEQPYELKQLGPRPAATQSEPVGPAAAGARP